MPRDEHVLDALAPGDEPIRSRRQIMDPLEGRRADRLGIEDDDVGHRAGGEASAILKPQELGGLACLVHGLAPALFSRTGSRVIRRPISIK